jgi:hypothetical protein
MDLPKMVLTLQGPEATGETSPQIKKKKNNIYQECYIILKFR